MPSHQYHGSGTVGGAHGKIQAEGHLHMVHRFRPDETMKQGAQEKQCDGVHGKGLDGPVDEKGEKYRFSAFARLDHLTEIDLDHDGVHHEEKTDGDGDGDHRCAVHEDGHAIQRPGNAGSDLSQQDAAEDAQ